MSTTYGKLLEDALKQGRKKGDVKVGKLLIAEWERAGWIPVRGAPSPDQVSKIVNYELAKLEHARRESEIEEGKKGLQLTKPKKKKYEEEKCNWEVGNQLTKAMEKQLITKKPDPKPESTEEPDREKKDPNLDPNLFSKNNPFYPDMNTLAINDHPPAYSGPTPTAPQPVTQAPVVTARLQPNALQLDIPQDPQIPDIVNRLQSVECYLQAVAKEAVAKSIPSARASTLASNHMPDLSMVTSNPFDSQFMTSNPEHFHQSTPQTEPVVRPKTLSNRAGRQTSTESSSTDADSDSKEDLSEEDRERHEKKKGEKKKGSADQEGGEVFITGQFKGRLSADDLDPPAPRRSARLRDKHRKELDEIARHQKALHQSINELQREIWEDRLRTQGQHRANEDKTDMLVTQLPLRPLAGQGGGVMLYTPYAFGELDTLCAKLPALTGGAEHFRDTLAALTAGVELCLGDYRAILSRVMGVDEATVTLAAAGVGPTVPSSQPAATFAPYLWRELHARYPTTGDQTAWHDLKRNTDENYDAYIDRAKRVWQKAMREPWNHSQTTIALFRHGVIQGLPPTVQTQLDGVVGLKTMTDAHWSEHVRHYLSKYQRTSANQDDELKQLQAKVLKKQLEDLTKQKPKGKQLPAVQEPPPTNIVPVVEAVTQLLQRAQGQWPSPPQPPWPGQNQNPPFNQQWPQRGRGRGNFSRGRGRGGPPPARPQPHFLCYNCNQPGHFARDCQQPQQTQQHSYNNGGPPQPPLPPTSHPAEPWPASPANQSLQQQWYNQQYGPQ